MDGRVCGEIERRDGAGALSRWDGIGYFDRARENLSLLGGCLEYLRDVQGGASHSRGDCFERSAEIRSQSEYWRGVGQDHADAKCRSENLSRPRASDAFDFADCAGAGWHEIIPI